MSTNMHLHLQSKVNTENAHTLLAIIFAHVENNCFDIHIKFGKCLCQGTE